MSTGARRRADPSPTWTERRRVCTNRHIYIRMTVGCRARHHIQLLLAVATAHVAATSQGQQDLTLAKIFGAIGTTNRFFVEFGFNGDSFETGSGANSEALYRQGWRGLLLDGRRSNATINLHTVYIKSTTIASVFRAHRVPRHLDYLSVDIDSADLWVLRSILTTMVLMSIRIIRMRS